MFENRQLGAALIIIGVLANNYVYSAEALVATQERLITALNYGITGFVPSDD